MALHTLARARGSEMRYRAATARERIDKSILSQLLTLMNLLLAGSFAAGLVGGQSISGPDIRIYKTAGTSKLTAHLFRPAASDAGIRRPAIVLFHGGGWVAGSPEWVYDAAKRYASMGAVAVAAEYRLSDQKSITPLDAIEDARDVILWTRANAGELEINPDRIAVYGVSAGGYLAASLAPNAVPNAMVLISPAVAVAHDGWFQKILLDRAPASEVSPDEHVGKTPPMAIFIGGADTLTPLRGVKRYCDRVSEKGGVCELHVYDGVGHLFTRKLDNQEDDFDPDPKAVEDVREKGNEFLRKRGFLNSASK